jgi:uncharacterized delta-60 repeat protein
VAIAPFSTGGSPEGTTGQVVTIPGNDVRPAATAPLDGGTVALTGRANPPDFSETRLLLGRVTGTGAADGTFDTDGFATVVGGTDDAAASVVVQPNGRVVVGGRADLYDGVVLRFLTNGTPDPSFATNGVAQVGFEVRGVALGPGGTIVAAGEGSVEIGSELSRPAGFIQRFLPSGAPDPTFNDGFPFVIDLGDDFDTEDATIINGLAVRRDGRILVVGTHIDSLESGGAESSLFAAQVVSGGGLDEGFGTDGVHLVGPVPAAIGRALALTADGGVVMTGAVQTTVGGASALQLVVARLTPTGQRQATFAPGAGGGLGNGVLLDPIGATSLGAGIAVRPDGRLVVAGTARPGGSICPALPCFGNPEAFVAQYSASGQRDSSFDGDGVFVTRAGRTTASAAGLTLDATGTVLVSGAVTASPDDVLLLALQPTGGLDTTFGSAGIVTTDLGFVERGAAVALAPDRRILVAGAVVDDRGERVLVARYDPVTVPPTQPTPPGSTPRVFNPTLTLNPAVGNDGSMTTAIGLGFPPNAAVTIDLSQGIDAAPSITTDGTGQFTVPVLIFPNDMIGPREMVATTTHPDTGAALTARGSYLVQHGSAQPGEFVSRR